MTVVATTFGRGGSKRVPRKNVKEFCGRPLIEWSIIQMKSSHLIDHAFVGTDDKEIAEIAERNGVDVIWDPPRIEGQSLNPVAMAAVRKQTKWFGDEVVVMHLLPTSPLRKPDDLDRAIRKWQQTRGHLIAMARRREMFVYQDIRGAVCRPVVAAKGYKYLDQCSGVFTITSAQQYLWITNHASAMDADIDAEREHDSEIEIEYPYEEVDRFQVYETDDEQEWELCELMMEHYILKGRGAEVYHEYAKDVETTMEHERNPRRAK